MRIYIGETLRGKDKQEKCADEGNSKDKDRAPAEMRNGARRVVEATHELMLVREKGTDM